jgi:hypothetical protein
MLVWDAVFGSWVGWSDRDRALLAAMTRVQRAHVPLLIGGHWTPLAARSDGVPPQVVGSCWTDGATTLWALANSGGPFAGFVHGPDVELELAPRGIAAVVDGAVVMVEGGRDSTFPAREAVRVPAPVTRVAEPPDGFVEAPPPPPRITSTFRRRETGTYGDAPYVEEWKPLPPRLHDFVEVERPAPRGRFAIAVREEPVTGLSLAEARAYASARSARLPTEDEWQLAAAAGLLERNEPLVWNWTESEHSDGRTRFAILKGGSAFRAEGSEWYVDGGPQPPEFSLQLLLAGPLQRSPQIGFRLAVDL